LVGDQTDSKREIREMLEKPRLFGNLVSEVIRPNLCNFCGACMAACPISALWPVGEQPTIVGSCALCEICYYQCPNVEFSREDVELFLHRRTRRPDEPIGILRAAYTGRASDIKIRTQGQDGGVVTALLAYALDSKLVDAAVVAGRDSVWHPKPTVAVNYEQLVANAGTKYSPTPILLGVRSAVDEFGKGRVAMVGTPCQIKAARRIQTSPLGNRRLAEAIDLTIGLFCMESYGYENLMGAYLASKGVDPSTVTKVGIKKGSFIAWARENEVLHVPLREIDQFVRQSCRQCDDFTADYADISVGAIGSKDGNSTVIARTEKGLELLKQAEQAGYVELHELPQNEKGFQKILNMAQSKRLRKVVQK
jgi:coenzyme F420 hydrogenase subunit beta